MSDKSLKFFEPIHEESLRRGLAPEARVVDGKRYDKRRAEKIADFADEDDRGFKTQHEGFVDEELYRTKSGAYFLIYDGGPHSIHGFYVDQAGFARGGGLQPLSPKEAMAWCDLRELDDEAAEIGEKEGLIHDA